jgi:glycosyltransferase involved in cell wall biosynthesis
MNKKWQKIIKQFNTPDTALVVSAWPVEGKNAINHGIAWYTKMTVVEMAKKQKKRFVILAETNHDNRPQLLVNDRVLVLRVFDNTHKSLYPKILQWLSPFDQIKKVYVHSEFGANGGIIHFAMILPFLALIRAMRKHIIFYSHNVIADIGMLSGHLAIPQWQNGVFNIAIKIYYKILALLSEKIVTLDPSLSSRLAQFVGKEKIASLQMPVEIKHGVSKRIARKKLGISAVKKVVTTFGFVSYYKGTDWLVNNIPNDIQLIVAGGLSYSLANKRYYQTYYNGLIKRASERTNVLVTGFVPEDKIGLYMAASDLVVLPYRGLMGSSGSWSHALAYSKPFMLSEHMQELMGDTNKQVLFALDENGMNMIEKTVNSKRSLVTMAEMAKRIADKRQLGKIVQHEYNVLYA